MVAELKNVPIPADADELTRLRHEYLDKQLAAVRARLEMLQGRKFTFDEEVGAALRRGGADETECRVQDCARRARAPAAGQGHAGEPVRGIPRAITSFRTAKLDAVFRAAIDGCRSRTLAASLAAGRRNVHGRVRDGQTWSAYNWYKGNFTSVIQVNTSLPITIDRAIDLACHEGYPGHHVYNALLEKSLVRDRGWIEFSMYPLFSPQSLIAEGTANFGIEVAFPGEARTVFERDALYPLAGLDPETAETYAAVQRAIDKLSYAGNEAARRYLNGTIDRDAAVAWLERGPCRRRIAPQRTHFFDTYRSYVINYNLGKDLVRAYIEKHGGTARIIRTSAGASSASCCVTAAAVRTAMRAIEISSPGPPDALRLVERPDPVAGPCEVLDRRRRRRGQPSRISCSGRASIRRRTAPRTFPGLEISGRIVTLGPPASRNRPQVARGRLAIRFVRSCRAAATLSCAPFPACSACRSRAERRSSMPPRFPRRTSPSGRTCSTAADWSPASGCSCTAARAASGPRRFNWRPRAARGRRDRGHRRRNARRAEALGATPASTTGREDFVRPCKTLTDDRGVDVVLDIIGGPYLARNLDCLAKDGRLVQIGLMGGATAESRFVRSC